MRTLSVIMFAVSLFLWFGGGFIRNWARARNSGNGIRRLLDARNRYEICGRIKNEHYNCGEETGYEWHYDMALYWQVRQVYEKARWSTLFGAFLGRVK